MRMNHKRRTNYCIRAVKTVLIQPQMKKREYSDLVSLPFCPLHCCGELVYRIYSNKRRPRLSATLE